VNSWLRHWLDWFSDERSLARMLDASSLWPCSPDVVACCLVHVCAQASQQGIVFGCLFIQVLTLVLACRTLTFQTKGVFRWEKSCNLATVALSFVFGN
jgi:hypothetical protein